MTVCLKKKNKIKHKAFFELNSNPIIGSFKHGPGEENLRFYFIFSPDILQYLPFKYNPIFSHSSPLASEFRQGQPCAAICGSERKEAKII